MKKTVDVILVLLFLDLIVAPFYQRAQAQYIDPGTGNFLFQLMVSGLLFLIFFFSRIKTRILDILRKREASISNANANK